MIRVSVSISIKDLSNWAKERGYGITTISEIMKRKLNIKSTKDLDKRLLNNHSIRSDFSVPLIYRSEEEQKDIENIIDSLLKCMLYLKDNNIQKITIPTYSLPYNEVTPNKQIVTIDSEWLCYRVESLKFIDGAIISDYKDVKYPEIKSIGYYTGKNIFQEELNKFIYGKIKH